MLLQQEFTKHLIHIFSLTETAMFLCVCINIPFCPSPLVKYINHKRRWKLILFFYPSPLNSEGCDGGNDEGYEARTCNKQVRELQDMHIMSL